MSDYTPTDRNLYDRYEVWAALRTPAVITHRDDHDVAMTSESRIVELRNEGGAEWSVMEHGERIPLDRVYEVCAESV